MGISGTGKSLTAKATANVFNIPLLKLDAGKIFGSLVGSSEANMRASDGMTGAEIESAFMEALYAGFEQEREPTDLDVATVLTGTVPLSKLMAEQVNSLRAWAKGR